jgi:hypothetical protein
MEYQLHRCLCIPQGHLVGIRRSFFQTCLLGKLLDPPPGSSQLPHLYRVALGPALSEHLPGHVI